MRGLRDKVVITGAAGGIGRTHVAAADRPLPTAAPRDHETMCPWRFERR